MNNINENTIKKVLGDFVEIFIIVLAVGALSWIFVAEPLEVTGSSMEPTLHDTEQIIVEKASLNFGELKQGDVIVFNSPKDPNVLVIKRIIALPGDTVLLQNGEVFVNNNILNESYTNGDKTEAKEKMVEGISVKIPSNTYFVLGDNRSNSTDSRDFGPIGNENLVGKAVVVYYPFNETRKIN